MVSENKNFKEIESDVEKMSEEILNELESTEVSGGIRDEVAEDKNYVQCGCNNSQCGKAYDVQ